jgi:hypothetical protein
MVAEGGVYHVSYISAEDAITFGLKSGDKVPKVTIEFVDKLETKPLTTARADVLPPIDKKLVHVR